MKFEDISSLIPHFQPSGKLWYNNDDKWNTEIKKE
jgi:hypothetical protein